MIKQEENWKPKQHNLACIDGQNLHLGTKLAKAPWEVDLRKFRMYLHRKYHVEHAYYFLGYSEWKYRSLYGEIQKAGYTLIFKQHHAALRGKKKGNVDADIIFFIMKKLYRREAFDNIVLVSGDGDYKILVDFLIEEGRFEKVLFPNKEFASSLYKKLAPKYFAYLDQWDIRNKIELNKKRGLLR